MSEAVIIDAGTGNTQRVELTPAQVAERAAMEQQEAQLRTALEAAAQELGIARSELIGQYQSAMTRLDQIIAAQSPTNAQVVAAIQDMALIQQRMLRLVKTMLAPS